MVVPATSRAQVRALVPGPRLAYRLVRWSEWVRERFWSIPAVLVLAGVLTAVVVCRPDLLGLPTDWDLGHVVRIRTADTMLQVMASSMLTFVGVVFAITLVGLQLASSQLSPRVIRTFVRSAITKTAFGVFLATFAFAVTGLAFDNVDDAAAASRTVGAAVAHAGAWPSVVFIVYVTATMRLLEVGWVITAVANEARVAIRQGVSARLQLRRCEPPVLRADATRRASERDRHPRLQGRARDGPGDRPRTLVRLATAHDCVIELLPRIGEYVPTGGPVFAVHGGSPPDDAEHAGLPRPGPRRGPSTRTRRSGSASWSTSPPRPCPRRSTSPPPRSRSSTACRTSYYASGGSRCRPGLHVDTTGQCDWSSRPPRRRTSSTSRSRRSASWVPRPGT